MALTWTLKLKDAMSGAAASASRAVGGLRDRLQGLKTTGRSATQPVVSGLDRVTTAANRAGKAIGIAQDKMGRWRHKNGKFATSGELSAMGMGGKAGGRGGSMMGGLFGDLAGSGMMPGIDPVGIGVGAAQMAAGLTAAVWGGIGAFGLMVKDAGAFKAATITAFENITKSKSEAQRAYALASKTAVETGADFRESVSAMNSLMAQGFDTTFSDQLVRAMADLRVINPAANLEGITRAISQIKSTGKLQGDEMMQLAEAGLNVGQVYEAIAKDLKIVGDASKSATQKVQDLQRAGKVSSDVAIRGIMSTIKSQVGGKDFGQLATEKANSSLDGAIARAMSLKEIFLSSINVDWSPAINMINRLVAAAQSPAGERFAAKLGAGLNRLVGMLDRVSQSDMEGMLDSAGDAFEHMTKQADKFVSRLERAAALYDRFAGGKSDGGGVFSMVEGAGDWLFGDQKGGGILEQAQVWLSEQITALSEWVTEAASGIGTAITDAISSAIDSGAAGIVSSLTGAVTSAIDGAKSVLGIKSPSKKAFAEIGAPIAQGAALGVDKNAAMLGNSTGRMAAQAFAGGQRLAGAITNNSSTRNFSTGDINITSGDESDGRATVRELADTLRRMNAAAA